MPADTKSATLRSPNTLARMAVVEGFGYWSGRDIRVEFHPAAPDTGVVFVRTDTSPACRIPVRVANRVESPRRTVLRSGQVSVEMVEHILAALAGLRIDNCEVHVNAAEMPGMDGSSLDFVTALDEAGRVPQPGFVPRLIITETLRVGDENSWIEARPAHGGGLHLKVHIDYGNESPIGRQTCQMSIVPDTFRTQLAPCRTFVLKEEANWLRGQGLATRPTEKDLLIFDEMGPIDNPLRFEDECVRHKALDLIGDLALTGCDITGRITAWCSGHRLNAEMAKAILLEGRRETAHRKSA